VGGRRATPRVAVKARPKRESRMACCLVAGEEHRYLRELEAPRDEREPLEPRVQKARHRWRPSWELRPVDV
jgi:hypothetical protein